MFPCIIQFWLVFLQPLMNKSISSVNLNLELDVLSTFWFESDASGTFFYILPSHHLTWETSLKDEQFWCRTDICSCKLSATCQKCQKIHFQFHPFLSWTISAFISSSIAWKLPANSWFPSEKTKWSPEFWVAQYIST